MDVSSGFFTLATWSGSSLINGCPQCRPGGNTGGPQAPRRDASPYLLGRHIVGNHRPHPDEREGADGATLADKSTGTQVGRFSNPDATAQADARRDRGKVGNNVVVGQCDVRHDRDMRPDG